MRVAIDTNILAYAEGLDDTHRQKAARDFLFGVPEAEVLLPAQALGELFRVLVRRGWTPAQARGAILNWTDGFPVVETSAAVVVAAADLVAAHQLSFWDGVILSAAAAAECRVLVSEDMQDGFTWRGVTVVNPFAQSPHPLLMGLTGA